MLNVPRLPKGVTDDAVLPGADRADLRDAAVHSARWVAALMPVTEIIAFVSTICIARLVSPAETGPAAGALIVLAVADIILYQGFGTTIIRRRNATYGDARIVLSLTLLTAVAGTALITLVCALPPVRSELGHDFASLLQLASIGLLITAPNVVPQAVLSRQIAFKIIQMRTAVALLIGASAGVGLAVAGLGGTAIIGGLLVQRLATTTLTQFLVPGIKPGWDHAGARELLAFGSLTSLAGAFSQMRKNIDYLILSLLVAPATVGLYYRAYILGSDYQQRLSSIIGRLSLPLFSRARDLADMWRIRRRLMRVQMSMVIPFLGIFVAVASLLIPTIYGERWSGAVTPAQILTLVAAIGLIANGIGPLVTAAGRPGVLATANGIKLVLYAATIALAAHADLVLLCVIVVIYNLVVTVASSYWMLNRVLGLSIVPVLHELVVPLVCIMPTVLCAFIVPQLAEPSVGACILWVAIIVPWTLVTYFGLMRALAPETFVDLRSAAAHFFQRKRSKAPASRREPAGIPTSEIIG